MFSRRTDWPLAPNAFARALEQVRASGKEILDLTVSNPTEAGVQLDPDIVLAALANPDAMRYEPQPRGLLEARKAVCQYYRESMTFRSRSSALADHHTAKLIRTCSVCCATWATKFVPSRATRYLNSWRILRCQARAVSADIRPRLADRS